MERFENYERRLNAIDKCLNNYGLFSLDDARFYHF